MLYTCDDMNSWILDRDGRDFQLSPVGYNHRTEEAERHGIRMSFSTKRGDCF